ncbi:MAG: prepilin-type N-terminal cleavage/methylation domain-containing protein [Snodgrassella sp.]|nr:prepilin-type N-terminal cleavage/methylation domain-containing protein [Snodgrassella sp.]
MKTELYNFQKNDSLEYRAKHSYYYSICNQNGFTLIELLVATAISIIVLLAASSTFITTYKLNQEVKKRISYEQDVRNAGDLLRTDARQLGNFGCMKEPSLDQLQTIFPGMFSSDNKNQFLSTANLSRNTLADIGLSAKAGIKPLLITYIDGKYSGNIIGAKCKTVIPNITNNISASYYVVGTTVYDKISGLYKINYVNGNWSAPQLLVSNVQDMSLTFSYDKHADSDCPKTASSNSVQANMEVSDDGKIKSNFTKPPILIKANLTVCPSGQYTEDKCKGNTTNYIIQAMVRKGEVCN